MTIFDWCRHCGEHKQMTEEHLPPKVAGNASPTAIYNEQSGVLTILRSFQWLSLIPSVLVGGLPREPLEVLAFGKASL